MFFVYLVLKFMMKTRKISVLRNKHKKTSFQFCVVSIMFLLSSIDCQPQPNHFYCHKCVLAIISLNCFTLSFSNFQTEGPFKWIIHFVSGFLSTTITVSVSISLCHFALSSRASRASNSALISAIRSASFSLCRASTVRACSERALSFSRAFSFNRLSCRDESSFPPPYKS